MNRHLRVSLVALLMAVVLGAGLYAFSSQRNAGSASFRTAQIKRGDLQITISATGTVQPEELVDVGAQVAGKILSFGQDDSGRIIDYGSSVEVGTVLARIDHELYAADVAQAEAQLAQARAGLQRSEADLAQLQARLDQAARDWSRARKLGPSEALSQSAYDAAQSAHEVAQANLAVGRAVVVQSRSGVAQAEAALRKARQNLEYCTIRSPVKGVIIDRRVNIGQTVVASLNAPSLFLIAKDLGKLQVWVAVNEADIGSIHPGQRVVFTVDAFPEEHFEGRVGKIRLNATLTQNVVSYIVEVNADNQSGRLLPYLTANTRFIVEEHHDVLMVPNAALRWTPKTTDRMTEDGGGGTADPAARTALPGQDSMHLPAPATLWIQEDGQVRPIQVRRGASDGLWSQVTGEEIREGMEVVVGERINDERAGASPTVNPFAPQNPWRQRTPTRSGTGPPR
ncbi:MAG: efflux RND transporter periplasmic adaptor subunit [Syntrophobacteraceae bacterium]|jgi:HlyD family secretion protein|nr:efflux RND transporter periplasmic adaptor subunit [Syntrophobacteraceae bacterium]